MPAAELRPIDLPEEAGDLAARLLATGIVSDPWLDGRPRFRARPVMLSARDDRALCAAAEAAAVLHDRVARLCWEDPALLDAFIPLTGAQRRMWRASAPSWHGLARADVFLTADGPKVCELNSDTPSGEAEAVLLNALVPRAGRRDPNVDLEDRFCALIETAAARDGPLTIGIVYPTEIVEDLSMILLYRRWFEARGWRVVLGAPYNLRRVRGRPALFDARCDVFVRHYKTDWWGERRSVWRNEPPVPDAAPLDGPLAVLLDAPVVNPFGAVVTQNKRALALMWEAIDRFPRWAQTLIRRYIPYTVRLEAAGDLGDREDWVLKSDYGCEGAEVVIGADCDDGEWAAALAQARFGRWIAQRRFIPIADADGTVVNHGVYVCGGIAAGYFCRVHRGATDYSAQAAPTFVEEEP